MSRVIKSVNIAVSNSFNLLNSITVSKHPSRKETDEKAESLPKSGQMKGVDYFRASAAEFIDQAKVDAVRIITEAKAEAQMIAASAAEKIERELTAAQEKGYADGLKKGREEALLENRKVISELQGLLTGIMAEEDKIIAEYEDEMYMLTLDIAKKIINRELEKNEQSFIDLFREAVKNVVNAEWIRLTVSGSEYQLACRNAEILQSLVNGAKHIDVILDQDASPGTCIVETPQGIIDAGVDTQLIKIKEMMEENRSGDDEE